MLRLTLLSTSCNWSSTEGLCAATRFSMPSSAKHLHKNKTKQYSECKQLHYGGGCSVMSNIQAKSGPHKYGLQYNCFQKKKNLFFITYPDTCKHISGHVAQLRQHFFCRQSNAFGKSLVLTGGQNCVHCGEALGYSHLQ